MLNYVEIRRNRPQNLDFVTATNAEMHAAWFSAASLDFQLNGTVYHIADLPIPPLQSLTLKT